DRWSSPRWDRFLSRTASPPTAMIPVISSTVRFSRLGGGFLRARDLGPWGRIGFASLILAEMRNRSTVAREGTIRTCEGLVSTFEHPVGLSTFRPPLPPVHVPRNPRDHREHDVEIDVLRRSRDLGPPFDEEVA